MTAIDAAKLLDLPADASPEHDKEWLHELRTRLKEKIGKGHSRTSRQARRVSSA
jgi:hypothetical protein